MTELRCICAAPLRRNSFSDNFDALACDRCGSRRFVPAAGAVRIEFEYDQTNDKYAADDYLYGKQLRWSHLQLLKRGWTGRRVAEIGCFNGFFLDELRGKGADAFGFDVNPAALAAGERLFGLGGRMAGTIEELAAWGPFDDVICIDVIEHLDDPAAFLQQIRAMLKPGGLVTVAGPIVERRFHDKSDYPPHHKWWFSLPGLQSMLALTGFDVDCVLVQHDAMLLLRNLLGKIAHGLGRREFHGQTRVVAPRIDGFVMKNLYGIGTAIGTLVFRLLRIRYCSAIVIARKAARHES